MTRNRCLQFLKWVWIATTIIFIGIFFYRNLPEAIQYLKDIPFWIVAISCTFIIFAKFLIVYLALLSAKTGGWHPSYIYMFTIFTVSQLGKYIPGSIWHFAARINAYKENALSNKKIAQVMLIENAWLVTGAAAFGIFCLSIHHMVSGDTTLFFFQLPEWLWNLLPWVILILWVFGLLILDRRFSESENRLIKSRIIHLMLVQAGIWLFLGISYLLLFPIGGDENIFLILGNYAMSWIAGYFVIFAPGGIGVRESVQVFLFSSIATPQQIVIVSFMHRMIYTFVEVFLGMVGYFISKKAARYQNTLPR